MLTTSSQSSVLDYPGVTTAALSLVGFAALGLVIGYVALPHLRGAPLPAKLRRWFPGACAVLGSLHYLFLVAAHSIDGWGPDYQAALPVLYARASLLLIAHITFAVLAVDDHYRQRTHVNVHGIIVPAALFLSCLQPELFLPADQVSWSGFSAGSSLFVVLALAAWTAWHFGFRGNWDALFAFAARSTGRRSFGALVRLTERRCDAVTRQEVARFFIGGAILTLATCLGGKHESATLLATMGLLTALLIMGSMAFFGSLAYRQQALGSGDIYLMASVGAISGPIAVPVVLFTASTVGLGYAVLRRSVERIAFFPALVTALVLYHLFWPAIYARWEQSP